MSVLRMKAGAIGLLLAVAWVTAWLALRPAGDPRREREATRSALRQQGFKTELVDFHFSRSPDAEERAAVITSVNATTFLRAAEHVPFHVFDLKYLIMPFSTNSATGDSVDHGGTIKSYAASRVLVYDIVWPRRATECETAAYLHANN